MQLFLYSLSRVLGKDTSPFRRACVTAFKQTVRRIGKSDPALYEFYNVFPENTLTTGNSYEVMIQAFDKNGAEIKGAVCKFTLTA